jgi:hypothetical protein
MKSIVIIVLLSLAIQASGQNISKLKIFGCWTESSEENTKGSKLFIYRPCDYKEFPPSRFRFRMELKNDSKCSWFVLTPNDGHYMVDGTWTYNEETKELKLINKDDKVEFKFTIVGVEDNMLTLKN